MTNTILIPLDGSALSEHVLPLATALARADGGRLLLVHARPPADSPSEPAPNLETVAAKLRSDGVPVETHTCRTSVANGSGAAILSAATEYDASLLVMATHGYGGLGRWLYGSVADQILRETTLPVVMMSPLYHGVWPADRPPRVLVPLDGSKRAEGILDPLCDLVRPLGVELVLLRVSESMDYMKQHGDQCPVCRAARAAGKEPDIEPVRSRHYLEGVAERLQAKGLAVEIQTATGDPAATITQVAAERGTDLIAMATHGRSGFGRVIMGSVATDVLRRATLPLLLVRSRNTVSAG